MTMPHPNALRGPWLTPGIAERLVELHALTGMETMSMGEIAAKLTFEFDKLVTRNAVIGRCQRECLPSRPQGQIVRIPKKRKSRKRSPRRRVIVEPIAPAVANEWLTQVNPSTGRPLTIYELNDRNCHFPLGEIEDRPPFFYCGKPAVCEGCAWCPEHYARTHVVTREMWA
jgi:hypothetical protein